MTDECLFCRIARGDLAVPLVAQNELAVAFRDINPQAPVHVLVIPRRHSTSVLSARDDDLAAVMSLASEVARLEGVADDGFRLVANTGGDGGQTVLHFHLHVLGGRAMHWPPG